MDVRIITTYGCNYNCWFCHHEGWHDQERTSGRHKFIQVSYLGDMLPILNKCGCDSVTLSGGEPCLHPEINHLIEMISSLGMKLTIVTNGSLLKRIHNFSAIDILNISIHTWDEQIYNQNSQGSMELNEVIENTTALGHAYPELDLRINTVIDKYLISHFAEIENYILRYKTVKLIEQFPLHSDALSIEAMEKLLVATGWKFEFGDPTRRKKYYVKYNTRIYLTRVFCAAPINEKSKREFCIANNELSISPDLYAKKCRYTKGVYVGDLSLLEKTINSLKNLDGVNCCYDKK